MPTSEEKLLNEQVLEIRYKPEARVLDHRGIWTRNLASQLGLLEWKISPNRLDVYEKDESKRAFISFTNAGCTLRNQDQSSFIKLTQSFLRFFLDLSPFHSLQIQRIGVLGRFAKKFDGSFERLFELYKKNYYTVQPAVEEIFKAELIDIGADLNFKADNGYINSLSGAMEITQLREFFPFEKEPPEVGIYFHSDAFFTPDISSSLPAKQIPNLVQEYIKGNWTRFDRLLEAIHK